MNCGSLVNATSLRHSQCVLQLARAAAAGVRPNLVQASRQAAGSGVLQQQVYIPRQAQGSRQHHVCAVAAVEPASTTSTAVAQEVWSLTPTICATVAVVPSSLGSIIAQPHFAEIRQ